VGWSPNLRPNAQQKLRSFVLKARKFGFHSRTQAQGRWWSASWHVEKGEHVHSNLHLIEEESDYLELNLNKSKCCYIAYNCQGQIRFQNGEPMKSSEKTTYLGASVTQHIDPKHEIRKRISATMAILKKLDIFWIKKRIAARNGNYSFSTETLEPTEAAGRLLNTFQLRAAQQFQWICV